MKRFASLLFLLACITACTQQPATPSPFPDTPAPAIINAPIVEAPALVTIQFLNELDGWGVTETQIVRTNDGGVTWYNLTPPELTEAGYSVDLFAFDADHIWIQSPDFNNFPNSGFAYRTTTGGSAWTKTATPFSRARITFLTATDAWALADLGVGAGSNAVAVYQTTDGGSTWNQTYINDPNTANAKDSLPLGGLKSGLAAPSLQAAFVHGVVYSQGTVYLFRTDNSGVDWREVALPLPADAQNYELSIDPTQMKFVSALDGYIALRLTGENYRIALYSTHDGGQTWALAPMLIPDSGSADFLSATDVVIYTGEQFYSTRDAGQTWNTVSPNILFDDTFAMMDFVNITTGWVITLDPTNQRALYRTTDGGLTWSPLIP